MTFKAKATRVLPAYRDLISDYIGMAQIILGFITMVFSIVSYVIRAFTSSASSGILTAIVIILCGIFGVLAGLKKELWAIVCYFLQSLISIIFAFVLFASSIVAVSYEGTRPQPTSVTLRESIDICMIFLGMLCGFSCIVSILLTGVPLFTDKCKCVKGAKYVQEPNVQYHNEVSSGHTNPSMQIDDFTTSNGTNEHLSVKEQQQGNIHSFENPQAKISDQTIGTQPEQASVYPI